MCRRFLLVWGLLCFGMSLSPAPTAEEAMVRADEHAMVHEALAELPVAMREVVTLREIEGLGYREIAEVTGTAVGTVMSRLARGRKVLQSRLSQLMERGGTHDH